MMNIMSNNTGFKKYPAYKDSGIEWSPQIPTNWQTRPVKAWFDVQLGKMLQSDSESPLEKKVPYLKALHVAWGNVQIKNLPEMWASQREIGQYGVKDGDLLVCEGGEVGRSGIVTNPPAGCIIQNALHRVRARNNAHISYLMYVLFAMGGADWFSILCNKATIAHFTREKFVGSKIPLPSFDEQKIIFSYLDRKTEEIDGLIAKKERMIELLKEERAAAINQAVTKGLDSTVEMKDSGIEWLGKVPKHWEIKKLKFNAFVQFSNVNKKSEEGELEVRLCNYVDVYYNDFITPDLDFMEATASPEEIKKFQLRIGDVIVTKDSEEWNDIAVPAYVASELPNVICGYHLAQIRPDTQSMNGKYLFWLLSTDCINYQFQIEASGVTRFGLGNYALSNSMVLIPPKKEQDKITDFLDRKTAQIDGQVEREKKSIELLKEFRTSLISEVVTGKIDVKETVKC